MHSLLDLYTALFWLFVCIGPKYQDVVGDGMFYKVVLHKLPHLWSSWGFSVWSFEILAFSLVYLLSMLQLGEHESWISHCSVDTRRMRDTCVWIRSSSGCFQNCEGIRTVYVWEKEWESAVLFSRSTRFIFFFLRRHCFNIPIHFSLRTGAVHNCVFGRKCIGKRWCVVSYIYKRIIGTINNVYMLHTYNEFVWHELKCFFLTFIRIKKRHFVTTSTDFLFDVCQWWDIHGVFKFTVYWLN